VSPWDARVRVLPWSRARCNVARCVLMMPWSRLLFHQWVLQSHKSSVLRAMALLLRFPLCHTAWAVHVAPQIQDVTRWRHSPDLVRSQVPRFADTSRDSHSRALWPLTRLSALHDTAWRWFGTSTLFCGLHGCSLADVFEHFSAELSGDSAALAISIASHSLSDAECFVRKHNAFDAFTPEIPLQPDQEDWYELIVVEMSLDEVLPLLVYRSQSVSVIDGIAKHDDVWLEQSIRSW